jgi:hypothetical protein
MRDDLRRPSFSLALGPGVRRRRVGVRPATQGSTSAPSRIAIAVGAARIEVHAGFDHALLSEVVEVLGGGR